MTKLKLTLPITIYSPQAINTIIDEVDNYTAFVRERMITKRAGLKPLKARTIALSEELTSFLQLNFTDKDPNLDELMATNNWLKGLLQTNYLVTVTSAAVLQTPERKWLVEWFRNNTHPLVLINFNVNPSLIGGLVVRTRSKIFDMSFVSKLTHAKQSLVKIIAHV